MSATAEDVLRTLQSIDAGIKALLAHFGAGTKPAAATGGDVPAIASAADLDGQYGNPEVKAKDPRDWTGDSMKGRRFNECPAEYLDLMASRLDWFAGNQDDPKKARYDRLDASRARGWAARIRAGYVAPAASDAGGFPSDAGAPLTDDQIPF